MKSIKTELTA